MGGIRKRVYEPDVGSSHRCLQIRCASKRGETISEEDRAFYIKMYERFPAWYRDTESTIFHMTKPLWLKEERDDGKV
jgi:hypothetical protein